MTWDCLKCDNENKWKGSFGDDEICEKCETKHESDWDYIDIGEPVFWITRVKEDE